MPNKKSDKVVRISGKAWLKINKLKKKISENKKEQTIPNFIDRLMENMEMLESSEPVYIHKGIVYEDLKVARGQSILEAAQVNSAEIDWPEIAIIINKDNGK